MIYLTLKLLSRTKSFGRYSVLVQMQFNARENPGYPKSGIIGHTDHSLVYTFQTHLLREPYLLYLHHNIFQLPISQLDWRQLYPHIKLQFSLLSVASAI